MVPVFVLKLVPFTTVLWVVPAYNAAEEASTEGSGAAMVISICRDHEGGEQRV